MRTKAPLIWILLSIVASAATAQTFRGELTARYRDRWGSPDYEDEDLYTYLRLSFWDDDEERELGGALSLRWDKDLLTAANERDDGDDDLRVYYAYLDVNKIERLDLRLGRQILDEAEGFNLTGIKGIYAAPWKNLRIGAFGGQPVSYSSAIDGDEWATGLTWSLKPDARCQLRGSWIHLEDDVLDQDVVTVAYRRSWERGANLYLTARTLDFDVFNELLGGSFTIQPLDLRLTGTYRRQEDTNSSASRYFGGLSSILGPSRPFHQLTLNLSRPIADLATLGLGYSRRALLDDAENRSNQEFTRLFFDVFLMEKLLGGFSANANWSRWETDRDDNSTLGGSIGRRVGEHLELSVGTFYSKYDLRRVFDSPDEIPTERFDVRSTYLRGDWRVRKRYRVRLDFDRTTDSTSDDAYYELELRFGLDLGFVARGFSE